MQKYNSFNGVPLTTKEVVEAGASAVANVASAGGTDVKETLESKLSSEIQQEVANEINNLQKARKEAEDLASKFNKPYQKTPSETKIENSIIENIEKVNRYYDDGHTIVYWTARGAVTGIDWTELTKEQLDKWGAKHHELKLDKPFYDIFIDDKNINVKDWSTDLVP